MKIVRLYSIDFFASRQVEPFQSIALFHSLQWYFIDEGGLQHGPILTRLLIHKLKEGAVDGLTMVYANHLQKWKPLGEIEELRAEIMKIAAAEQEAEKAAKAAEEEESQKHVQVFIEDDDTNRVSAYQEFLAAQQKATEKAAEDQESLGDKKKRFTADNGIRYCWDDAEQDWIEDEDEDDDLEQTKAVGDSEMPEMLGFEARKRKATTDGENDEEDSGADSNEETEIGKLNSNIGDSEVNIANNFKEKKRRAKKKKRQNNWIYISGLPSDVTVEEIHNHFSKVRLIIYCYIKLVLNNHKGKCT
jgi:hypothetical protein